MIFYPEERLALFIDGANLYATARALDMEIDYKSLRRYFSEKARLIRSFYYTAILEDQEYSPLRPLIDWLDYNGFTLVTKPVKEFTDEHGRRKIKGNMDIEIAVDMLNISEALDHVVLFSGDGDFRRLLEAIQRRGVRATVVSSNRTQPSMIADELRRQADQFVDLEDLRDVIGRSGGGSRQPDPREAYQELEVESN
ncbi:MAG: NYN domain-containing protein [Alphaproteobacteria bacterium]|nr:NYN domain-containing protein [Alphaproteobacteria bacterium]